MGYHEPEWLRCAVESAASWHNRYSNIVRVTARITAVVNTRGHDVEALLPCASVVARATDLNRRRTHYDIVRVRYREIVTRQSRRAAADRCIGQGNYRLDRHTGVGLIVNCGELYRRISDILAQNLERSRSRQTVVVIQPLNVYDYRTRIGAVRTAAVGYSVIA